MCTVEEGNKLIAEFMEFEIKAQRCYHSDLYRKMAHCEIGNRPMSYIERLKFNSSWDWLMPVVEKISRIEYDRQEQDNGLYIETIIDTAYPRTFGMISNQTRNPMFRFNRCQLFEAETLIQAAWIAVVDFIQNK